MISAYAMRLIIKRSLDSIQSYHHISESDVNLIELTFLMESDMTHMINHDRYPVKHGLMGWTRDQMETFIREVVRTKPTYAKDINNIALIDVHEDSFDDMFEACAYNVAFQTVLTYLFYRYHLSEMPIGIDEVITSYFKIWIGAEKNKKKDAEKAIRDWIVSTRHNGRFVA